jgi:hypothetical protein
MRIGPESNRVVPAYWATVFYCPMHDASVCNMIQAKSSALGEAQDVNMTVSLAINNTIWSNNFVAIVYSYKRGLISYSKPFGEVGVYAAIPYTTTDQEKLEANGALLPEWLRC